jgi:hypothetical protein
MPIISIEPTPSPNTMKITLEERLPDHVRETFTKQDAERAPEPLGQLLTIEGVKSLYRAADFIALDRTAHGDWQRILTQVRELLGEAVPQQQQQQLTADARTEHPVDAPAYGEVTVKLQHFRGIPLQLRAASGTEEQRAALPDRFNEAAIRAAAAAPNLIKERTLDDWGTRYGELQEVLNELVQEIDASFPQDRLERLVHQAMEAPVASIAEALEGTERTTARSHEELLTLLSDPDWKKRYAALQQTKPSHETLPLLVQALRDEKSAIRRLAAVYIGDLKEPVVLPYLYEALKDDSVSVRRTAGDTLSDLGFPEAQGAMAEALCDPNKLVRWRAARFLYEAGDHSVLPALHAALEDPEFEVRMQIRMAIERIEGGEAAAGSVWQQMAKRNE